MDNEEPQVLPFILKNVDDAEETDRTDAPCETVPGGDVEGTNGRDVP